MQRNCCDIRIKVVAIIFFIQMLFGWGCKKLVDIESPPTRITGENIYQNDLTATAALTSLYAGISLSSFSGTSEFGNVGKLTSLSADELWLWNGINSSVLQAYYTNNLTETSSVSSGSQLWNICYNQLYVCNSAIEGIISSTTLTPAIKQQLLGEAKFMRAFFYFYLTNLYGDIPLILSTDYTTNRLLSRSSMSSVYEQIISDLKDAQGLLSSQYLDISLIKSTTEKVRPTKFAATALLARTYLYSGDWANAETQATTIISNTNIYDTVPLNSVFLKNSKEAIWQLQPVNTNWNTEEARAYIIPVTGFGPNNPYSISSLLLNSFETGDQRRNNGNWVKSINLSGSTYYYPYKYKSATNGASVTEYWTIFRLGEQYLIRAEARAQLNKISECLNDLNVIRKRAGLPNANSSDKTSLLNLIYHERQVELFTEWGLRWFDLKRTQNINDVMSVVTPSKGGSWESTDQLYPIPFYDLQRNPNLTQNLGY
jgi:starch-binding outer membrane protein, SusD/RagB family